MQPLNEKMKAICITHFGGPEVLEMDSLLMPVPGFDELLVKIEAASVNPVDYKIRKGDYPSVPVSRLPVVMGRDLCGTVVAHGPSVSDVQAGDAVYAFIGQSHGTYAEYAVVKSDEYARKPKALDAVSAAAVPLAGITAWQALFDHGNLVAGERVLIHGGAGGVGHLAVQFAKAMGATVITTVSKKDLEFARYLGADQVIDHGSKRFEDGLHEIDLVVNLTAGDTLDRSWQVLKAGTGRLVSTVSEPSPEKAQAHRVRAVRFTAQPNGSQLAEIALLIDAGKVRVEVERVFPWHEAAAAQQHLEQDHVRGKVVLRMD